MIDLVEKLTHSKKVDWTPEQAVLRSSVGDLLGARISSGDLASDKNLSSTVKLLQSLTPERFLRLLDSPEFFYSLLPASDTNGSALLDQIRGWIMVELALDGKPLKFDQASNWSCCRDVVVGQEGLTTYSANRVAGIVLDSRSPSVFRDMPTMDFRRQFSANKGYTTAQEEDIRHKLEDTFELLRQLSPPAHAMLLAFIRKIDLRNDAELQGCSGSSSHCFVGRFCLNNGHDVTATPERLLDTLIHESVHSLLYIRQLNEEIYNNSDSVFRAILRSPWTGNALSLHSYVQACFVWYSLGMFWANVDSVGGRIDSSRYLRIAKAGFFKGQVIEELSKFSDQISEEAFEAIDQMQKTLLRCL